MSTSLRRATPTDAAPVAELYLRSFRWALPTVTLAHTDDEVRGWWRDVVIPTKDTWVAVDAGDVALGVLALQGEWIDALYLEPRVVGTGIGRALLDLAQQRRPGGLSLYTFAVNARARGFYEHHGFVATWFGDGRDNEEGAPDVLYRWAPAVVDRSG